MSAITNRRWLLAERPKGPLQESHFKQDSVELDDLVPGDIRVKLKCLSFDPTQRMWIQMDTYLPAVAIGDVVRALGAGEVVESKNESYPVGTLVQGTLGWQEFYQGPPVTETGPLSTIPPGVSPEDALGRYGMTSVTAWFGVQEILKPKPGETAVISGAAGATGSVAGQILKAQGVHVIGIAGGPEKVNWVTETAGFDACIDYKSEAVGQRIKALAPKGVNLVFENVGGAILDASLAHLAMHARIALCGGISDYDTGKNTGIKNYLNITVNRARLEGFIVMDYYPRIKEAFEGIGALEAQGKLHFAVDMQEGFENIPTTLKRLFEGKNFGKQLLKIS